MKRLGCATVCVLLLVTSAAAKKQAPSAPPTVPPASSPPTAQPWLHMEITPLERDIVYQHLGDIRQTNKKPGKDLPPGLAKKVARGGQLPPGWQKKVARGEVLPPTVYTQVVIRKLPPPPAGTILITLDGKLIRLMEATRTILDVLTLP